jgi:pimeloyl-ACP methyl ester carboxylesterase
VFEEFAARLPTGVTLFTAVSPGPAARTLLVIHGGPDWDHTYLRVPLDRVGAEYRVVLPDLRGCGRSTTGLADGQYTPDAVVGDLLALLDHLGAARAAILGFSFGGLIGQRLLAAAPGRVSGLIVASSSVLPVPPDAFAGWAERDERVAAEAAVWADATLTGPAFTRAAAVAGARANVWRPESLPGYLRLLSEVHFTAEWLRPYRAGVMPSPWLSDGVAALSAAGRPVLLLQGEHDMTFPAVLAGQAAARIPGATAVVLAGAGHMAHVDDPGGWLAAVRRFLDAEELWRAAGCC